MFFGIAASFSVSVCVIRDIIGEGKACGNWKKKAWEKAVQKF
jgi:hypothetical protein